MKGNLNQFALSLTLVFIIVGSGAIGGLINTPLGNKVQQVANQTINFGDGSSVDVNVNGNVTTLTFSDGAVIKINASEGQSEIEFWENIEAQNVTRIKINQQQQLSALPSPFEREIPDRTTSIKIELEEVFSSRILSSWEFMTSSSDNTSYPSVTQISGMVDDGSSIRNFETNVARNDSHFGMRISATDSAIPTELVQMELTSLAPFPTNVTLKLSDQNDTDLATPDITAGKSGSDPLADSFLDLKLGLNMDGLLQDHEVQGTTTDGIGSGFTYNNLTGGFTDSQTMEPGLSPQAFRYPSPSSLDDPTLPFDILDIVLSEDSVALDFGGLSLTLYLDKLVINYRTWTGTYVPVIIIFEVWEVHITIYEVSVIIYLQVIELVMVIVVYEIVKIEVYIQYTVIVVEILQITLIEITIIHIDIDILIINIDITINIWVFKIVVKVVKTVIVFIPLWIIIIPIFIPVPIPVFIPVPTPVPVPVLQTDVDLFDQTIDDATNLMNLTYFVSDEYGNPLSKANVSLTMSSRPGMTFFAAEIIGMPGFYQFTNLPADSQATITVTADLGVTYRPLGFLAHSFSHSGTTVIVRSNVTQTQTNTQIVQTTITVTNGTQGTGTSPVSVNFWMVLSSVVFMTMAVSVLKKRKPDH